MSAAITDIEELAGHSEEAAVDVAEQESRQIENHDRLMERLLVEAEAASGPVAWPRVESFLAALVDMYGVALARMVDIARATATRPADVDARMTRDEIVSSLLAVHDLLPHPPDPTLIPAERLTKGPRA